jgi:hypothetical protein
MLHARRLSTGPAVTPDDCRRLRQAHGLTHQALAALAGLAERTVIRFEGRVGGSRHGTVLAIKRGFQRAEQARQQAGRSDQPA